MIGDRTMKQEPRPKLLDLFCGAGGAAMGYHISDKDTHTNEITITRTNQAGLM